MYDVWRGSHICSRKLNLLGVGRTCLDLCVGLLRLEAKGIGGLKPQESVCRQRRASILYICFNIMRR